MKLYALCTPADLLLQISLSPQPLFNIAWMFGLVFFPFKAEDQDSRKFAELVKKEAPERYPSALENIKRTIEFSDVRHQQLDIMRGILNLEVGSLDLNRITDNF